MPSQTLYPKLATMLFLLFQLVSPNYWAQSVTFSTSSSISPVFDGRATGILGFDSSNYFIVRNYKGEYYLERLSPTMKLEQSEYIQLEIRDKWGKIKYNGCRLINNRLYMFYYGYDSKHCTLFNTVYEIDKKLLKSIGKPITLNTVAFKGRRSMNKSIASRNATSISISRNENRILLINAIQIESNTNPNNMKFILDMYDNQFNKIWNKTINIPHSPDLFRIESTRIESNGSIIIQGIKYQERNDSRASRRTGKPNYTNYIYYLDANKNDVQEYRIQLNGEFISDVTSSVSTTGDIVISGFYSETGTFSIKGAFYQRINPNSMTVITSGNTKFEDAFIQKYATPETFFSPAQEVRIANNGKPPEFFEYNLKNMLLKNDGGATLIAEQYYVDVESSTVTTGAGSYTINISNYFYNNILVINFNSDGRLLWNTVLPKYQHSVQDNGYFSSFSLVTNGSNLFFIYNDNYNNINNKEPEKPNRLYLNGKDTTVLVLSVVDEFGQVSKRVLITSKHDDYISRPRSFTQTGPNEILLSFEKEKYFYLYKLTL